VRLRTRQLLALFILSLTAGVIAWAVLRFTPRRSHSANGASARLNPIDLWNSGVQKAKEDRGEPAGAGAAVAVPPQLKHYSDNHWFLATQIAEVRKLNITTCQDFVDLARLLARREIVPVPLATETYILLGVGANADGSAFRRFQDDHSVGLYDATQLKTEYTRIANASVDTQKAIADLQSQLRNLKSRDRGQRADLQKQSSGRNQKLASLREEKAQLDQVYGNAQTRDQLLADYQELQTLAKDFGGRSYDLDEETDRQALKINMLSSLRPPAFKVLEQIARAYHDRFSRPLPVSSLTRPEEYQHVLHRTNRNAVIIDTPPHSTGLAFDIDYRYMSAAEQSFLMNELARMKDEGAIEVLRERNANYHVFVFLDGQRPSDDLIAASLEAAGAPAEEMHHADKTEQKSKRAPRNQAKAQPRKRNRH